MSLYDYRQSMEIKTKHYPFYSLIMGAMRQADSTNADRLRSQWPEVWDELQARYNTPGGRIPADHVPRSTPDRRIEADQGFVAGMELRENEDRRR